MNGHAPLPNRRARLAAILVGVLAAVFFHLGAHAEQEKPDGFIGWWYYRGSQNPDGYADEPLAACQHNAHNVAGEGHENISKR